MRDITELQKIYDQEHRYAGEYADYQKEVLPNLVRLVNPDEREGFIIFAKLDESSADRVIQEQIDYFTHLGFDFEWKYFSHDTPADLTDRLAGHGFEVGEDEAIMALDIEDAPELLTRPVSHTICRVTGPSQVRQVREVLEQVYGEDYGWVEEMITGFLTKHADYLSAYLALDGDRPVAAGWSFFNPPSPFVGLYGGATLESHRGRGFYTALVAARLQEARQRGFGFLTVDAGPMSRPILKKLGFQRIATSNPCKYTIDKTTAG